MRPKMAESWVVYLMPVRTVPDGLPAVCEQTEWDAMDRANPGRNKLIQAGRTKKGEAERLARGTSGATVTRTSNQISAIWPGEVDVTLAMAQGQLAV